MASKSNKPVKHAALAKATTPPVAAKPALAKVEPVKAAAPAKVEPVAVKPPVEIEVAPARPTPTPPIQPTVNPVITAAPALAAAAIQEGQTMQDNVKKMTDETTERAKAMFGEAGDRAKSTMEKTTRIAEDMAEFGRGNLEAVMASSKVAAKGVETLSRDAADYGRRSYENATAALKGFASVKSPTELFQMQGEFARTAFDAMVAEASKSSEKLVKLAGDVFQPLSNRFAVAADKVKANIAR